MKNILLIAKRFLYYQSLCGFVVAFKIVFYTRLFPSKFNVQKIKLKFLRKDLDKIIRTYLLKKSSCLDISLDCPIWIIWFQGKSSMPPIIEVCYNSVIKHACNHPVNLITWDNLSNYCKLPARILELAKNKKISYALFADVVRTYLLSHYGGIYLDATIYVTSDIKGFKGEFFSIRQNDEVNREKWVSQCKWTSFMMASAPQGLIVEFLYECLTSYLLKYDKLLDYFLIDYILRIGYDNIPSIHSQIDSLPYSNPHLYTLSENMLSSKSINEILEQIKDTQFSKLDRRVTSEDSLSIYQQLIKL